MKGRNSVSRSRAFPNRVWERAKTSQTAFLGQGRSQTEFGNEPKRAKQRFSAKSVPKQSLGTSQSCHFDEERGEIPRNLDYGIDLEGDSSLSLGMTGFGKSVGFKLISV